MRNNDTHLGIDNKDQVSLTGGETLGKTETLKMTKKLKTQLSQIKNTQTNTDPDSGQSTVQPI